MSSEDVIDSRLPYRVGCPTLPVMPVKTLRSQAVTMFGPVPGYRESDIKSILDRHEIPLRKIFFAYRVTCGMDTDTGGEYLVILSTYKDGCQDRWVRAVSDIRTSLLKNELNWSIELVDHDVYYQPLRASPVPSTDQDLIEGWEKIRPEFEETLENHGHDWVSIDVLYRDFPSRENQPTAIISARDADGEAWWDETIPVLKHVLQTNGLGIDIVLLYLKDLAFLLDPHSTIRADFYAVPIRMGASCATSTSASSGTLGGRIRLRNDSSTLELGLTNYHVMMEGCPNEESLSVPFCPDSGQPYGAAVSPSKSDHNAVVNSLKKTLRAVKKQCNSLALNLGYLTENDPAWEAVKSAEDRELSRYETLKIELKLAEKTPLRIGDIYAASGFRTCKNKQIPADKPESRKNWALDWCLIQMDQSRPISNELLDVPLSAGGPDDAAVTQYCKISPTPNYKVIKRGRTSGYTKGTISAIASTIRSTDGANGRTGRSQGIPQIVESTRPQGYAQTEEISPTNSRIEVEGKWGGKVSVYPIISTTKKVLHFMEPGDSGSLILLDRRNPPVAPIVGLGFAGNDATLASYMMPIDLILKDIESVTGSKVVEPLYAGEADAED
jgi:hypothetical protein